MAHSGISTGLRGQHSCICRGLREIWPGLSLSCAVEEPLSPGSALGTFPDISLPRPLFHLNLCVTDPLANPIVQF